VHLEKNKYKEQLSEIMYIVSESPKTNVTP